MQAAAKHNTDDVSCVVVVWSEETLSPDEPLPPSRKGSKDSTSMRALINAAKKADEAALASGKPLPGDAKPRPSTPDSVPASDAAMGSGGSPFPTPKLLQLGKSGSVAKLKQ